MSKFFSDVFERDCHRCVYCGRDMLVDFDTFMMVQEDHLVPKSHGGRDELDNIVTACAVCNLLKGDYCPEGNRTPSQRPEYIASIRTHIMQHRAERMADFTSWTCPTRPWSKSQVTAAESGCT